MLIVAWSWVACAVLIQLESPPIGDAIALYQQAAQQLRSANPTDATPTLQALISQHPRFALAPLAAVRLAECYQSAGNHLSACETLLRWSSHFDSNTADAVIQELDSDLQPRVESLMHTVVNSFSGQEMDLLESMAIRTSSDNSKCNVLQAIVLSELARRYSEQGNYARSLDLLRQMGVQLTTTQQRLRDYELPLAILQQTPSLAEIQQLHPHLLNIAKDATQPLNQRFSLLMSAADAFYQLADLSSARSTLDTLAAQLQDQCHRTQEISNEFDSLVADWQAAVHVRRAELMALQQEYTAAHDLAQQSLARCTNIDCRGRFQIVIARCLIADVQFDRAREQLRQIVQQENYRKSSRAQAQWMLGEIDFLQRQYLDAISQFKQVPELDTDSQWHLLSWLQLGKCYELLSQPEEASRAYVAAMALSKSGQLYQFAQTRLDLLPATQQVNLAQEKSNVSIEIQR